MDILRLLAEYVAEHLGDYDIVFEVSRDGKEVYFYGRAPDGVLDGGGVPPDMVARLEAKLPPDSRRLAEFDKVVAKVDIALEAASLTGPLGQSVAVFGRMVAQLGRIKLEKGSISKDDFEKVVGNAVLEALVGRIFKGPGGRLGAARGGASAARGASTAFGRSVQSLKEFVGGRKGPWERLSAHAEQATKRSLRGGTSLEEVFRNTETGEQIIRHTLINRSGNIVHETFRTYSKFGW